MVTRRIHHWLFAGALAVPAAACNWAQFDELADEAWVDRVTKPEATDSRQYGVALVAMQSRDAGTQAFVLGKARASLSTLGYDDEGHRRGVEQLDPRSTLSFAGFPDRPALAADPDSDRIAFTVVMGENVDPTRIAVYDGRTLAAVKSVVLPAQHEVDGTMRHNIYAEGVAFATLPGFGMDTIKELVVARGPQLVVIQDYSEADTGTTFSLKGCRAAGSEFDWSYAALAADIDGAHAGPELLIAVGEELRNGMSEILVLDPAQVTQSYDTTQSCEANVAALGRISSSEGAVDLGARMMTAQFPDVADGSPGAMLDDLIYSAPSLNKVFVKFGGGAATEVSPGDAGSEFGDALAVGDLDGDGVPELVVGAPRSDPGGVSNGGSVYVYRFVSGTASFELAMTLHPAEPAEEERFGKSVTVAPFGATGDRNVLMVGAEGEVFTYFRTSEYDDVRTGRAP
ncbi:MAG TPA: FG-GAP repeat protein [Kofleriaceae bacterium]|nr:FG-GAP repeat protein [Kofleriaceae bacterium]